MIIDEILALFRYAKAHGPRPTRCYIPDGRIPELEREIEEKNGKNILGWHPRMSIKGMLVYPTNSGSIWVSE